MSALLENSAYVFKATIEKAVTGFFVSASGFHDMEHTHIARIRLRCWTEVINCVRYPCTLDWYMNRYIVEDDDEETTVEGKFEEYLILRILARAAPSTNNFNNEAFVAGINEQIEKSKFIKHVKKYFIPPQTASKT